MFTFNYASITIYAATYITIMISKNPYNLCSKSSLLATMLTTPQSRANYANNNTQFNNIQNLTCNYPNNTVTTKECRNYVHVIG